MRYNDSLFHFLVCIAALVPLSACVSAGSTTNVGMISTALSGNENQDGDLIDEFRSVCLSGQNGPTGFAEIAETQGWKASEQTDLKSSGLALLKKQILSIPGGGGRFDEEQMLYSKETDTPALTLNLERRYTANTTLSSLCEIYGRVEFLKTCEALGNAIGKAPDHNQKYPQKDAHFIRWDVSVDALPATISCQTAPQSSTLPYDGISLSLQIDHLSPVKKPKANPPGAGVQEP